MLNIPQCVVYLYPQESSYWTFPGYSLVVSFLFPTPSRASVLFPVKQAFYLGVIKNEQHLSH